MKRKVNVGIVGLGRAGRDMQRRELEALPDQFEIVAAADHCPERLRDLPEAFGRARLYGHYAALLADPNVELVAIAVRHPEHTPFAIQALEAGKAVSVDKPLALSARQFAALEAAAIRHPGKLFPRHNRRFEAPFQKVLQQVRTGVLGSLTRIHVHRMCGYCRRNDWMTMTAFGGGLLTNWGPHVIDQALQLLGSRVVDVWADVRSVISIGNGDDQIKLMLRGENGVVADVEMAGSCTLPGRAFELWGARGMLVYDPGVDGDRLHLRFVDPDFVFQPRRPHAENPPLAYGNFEETLPFVDQWVDIPARADHEIWSHVYDSLVDGRPFPIALSEAREVVRVTDLAFSASGFPRPDWPVGG